MLVASILPGWELGSCRGEAAHRLKMMVMTFVYYLAHRCRRDMCNVEATTEAERHLLRIFSPPLFLSFLLFFLLPFF